MKSLIIAALLTLIFAPIAAFAVSDNGSGSQRNNDNRAYYHSEFAECGSKTKCSQMKTCDEARYYLTICKVSRLDRDKDGTPCESICK